MIDNFYNNLDLVHYLLENKNHLVDVQRQNVKCPQDVLQNTKMKKGRLLEKEVLQEELWHTGRTNVMLHSFLQGV